MASTSAEESVRAVLEHVVGEEKAARFGVFAGDVVPAKKPDPGDLPARARALGRRRPPRRSSIEDSRNGLLRGRGRGPALRRHRQRLHGATRTSARRCSWSRASGDPGEPAAGPRQPQRRRDPGEYVTLADLQACLNEPLPQEEAV